MTACASGDDAAFRALYDRMASQLLGVAVRILGDRALAEDAVHEAFVQIWRRAPAFSRQRGSAKAWMISILRYRAIDMRRRTGREIGAPDVLDGAGDESRPDAEQTVTMAQETARMHDCLEELEDRQRQAVRLAYLDGCSREDIAQRLDAPVGTAKSWIHRGLKALRECLER